MAEQDVWVLKTSSTSTTAPFMLKRYVYAPDAAMVTGVCSFCSKIGERFYPYCNDRQSLTFTEIQMFFRDEQKVSCDGRSCPSFWVVEGDAPPLGLWRDMPRPLGCGGSCHAPWVVVH